MKTVFMVESAKDLKLIAYHGYEVICPVSLPAAVVIDTYFKTATCTHDLCAYGFETKFMDERPYEYQVPKHYTLSDYTRFIKEARKDGFDFDFKSMLKVIVPPVIEIKSDDGEEILIDIMFDHDCHKRNENDWKHAPYVHVDTRWHNYNYGTAI